MTNKILPAIAALVAASSLPAVAQPVAAEPPPQQATHGVVAPPPDADAIDARTQREDARNTAALNALEANGYADFANFRPEGKNFAADVARDGRPVVVVVDPDTGQITRRS
jgi:hypothetical protein